MIDDASPAGRGRPALESDERGGRPPAKKARRKKPPPPERTSAEAYYYLKQMQSRTPMTLVLNDGERLHGVIEWYDRDCLKLHRDDAPNLLVYKDRIKYMHKSEGGADDDDED